MYNCRGNGIYLVRNAENIRRCFQEGTTVDELVTDRLIQRYIMNPLLLEGRKFDIRVYMHIASTVPYVVLYNPGYVRLSLYKYDNDTEDLTAHLTNQYVQKQDATYEAMKENTVWSMNQFNDYINANIAPYENLEKDWAFTTLQDRIQTIISQCFEAVKNHLQCRLGYFELFGLDFMVDEDMKVWLLEVTLDPSLDLNCTVLKETISPVIAESLHITLECFEKSTANQPIMPLESAKLFSLIHPQPEV